MPGLNFKEPTQGHYIYLDDTNTMHLLIPLLNGNTLGTDNTCQTLNAFIHYFTPDTSRHLLKELTSYIQALKFDLFLLDAHGQVEHELYQSKHQRLDQLKEYLRLYTTIEQDSVIQDVIKNAHYPQAMKDILADNTNLFSAWFSDRPRVNGLQYGHQRSSSPVCNFISSYLSQQSDSLRRTHQDFGIRLRQSLFHPLVQLQTGIAKRQLLERAFPLFFNANNEDLAALIAGVTPYILELTGEQVDLTHDRAGNLITFDSLEELGVIDRDSNALTCLDAILNTAGIVDEFWYAHDEPFVVQVVHQANPEQLVNHLVLLTQFFISHVAIYARANQLTSLDFGILFDNHPTLDVGLNNVLRQSLEQNISSTCRAIFDYLNAQRGLLDVNRELTDQDYQTVYTRFKAQAALFLNAQHKDEMMVFTPETRGNFVNRSEQILTSFALFSQKLINLGQARVALPQLAFINQQATAYRQRFCSEQVVERMLSPNNFVNLAPEFPEELLKTPAELLTHLLTNLLHTLTLDNIFLLISYDTTLHTALTFELLATTSFENMSLLYKLCMSPKGIAFLTRILKTRPEFFDSFTLDQLMIGLPP